MTKPTIILDFIGVIADVDYINLIKDLPLKQKFSGLRIFVTLKKNKKAKEAFNNYQKGLISSEDLENVIAEFCPKSAYIVPVLLSKISKYTEINEDVLEISEILRSKGIQVIVISNTIPETEKLIYQSELPDFVDGIICSTEVNLKKPTPDIFKFAIDSYNIDPIRTYMIDDTEKNLRGAEKFGILPIKCKSSKETMSFLETMLKQIECPEYSNSFKSEN